MALQHLRSSTANKRPLPAGMSDGQLAINTESTSPGLFFKNSGGNLVKVGPVHVGTTAPNATPASGGQSGNSTGELWLDTSLTPNELKTWDGSAWVSATGQEIPVSKLIDGSARQLLQTDAAGTGVEWTSNVDVPGTLDVTGAAVFDSSVAVTGTLTKSGNNVVTVGDTGTVTSTMILDGTIVNDDVNASAAIAGTKISPDFGSQTVTTTGVFSSALGAAATPSITFTGDLNTGIYSPGADQVAISTSGTGRVFVDGAGRTSIGTIANNVFDSVGTPRPLLVQSSSTSTTVGGSTNSITICNSDTTTSNTSQINFAAITGASTNQYSSAIISAIHGARTNGQYPTGSLLFLTSTATNSAPSEKLRITSDGKLGLGTSSPSSSLEVRGGEIRFGDASASATSAGRISYGGGSGELDLNAYSTGGSTVMKFLTSLSGSNSERVRIDSSGRLLVGTSSDSGGALLQVNGNRIRVATAKTPASATDTGTAGEICWDASYIYVCTATNTWKRAALSTW